MRNDTVVDPVLPEDRFAVDTTHGQRIELGLCWDHTPAGTSNLAAGPCLIPRPRDSAQRQTTAPHGIWCSSVDSVALSQVRLSLCLRESWTYRFTVADTSMGSIDSSPVSCLREKYVNSRVKKRSPRSVPLGAQAAKIAHKLGAPSPKSWRRIQETRRRKGWTRE